jgi:SAM-dependent methyltransferase
VSGTGDPASSRDSRERFTQAADLYHRHRPGYPDALVSWLAETTGVRPPAPVADVGCGTGISTRLLAAHGYDVVGVDPNERMLGFAREAGGGPRYLRGEAAATGLREASVDLVVAAQAFHWFDRPAAYAEFRRILRPGGAAAALWNLPAPSPLMSGLDALLREFSTEYHVVGSWRATLGAIAADAGVRVVGRGELPNVQRVDLDGFLGRVFSASYVTHGVADKDGFERRLRDLFAGHERAGTVDLLYRTDALAFRPVDPA